MVDSIKVYVKSKSAFSWPEDEDMIEPAAPQNGSVTSSYTMCNNKESGEGDLDIRSSNPAVCVDQLLSWSLQVLDACFVLSCCQDKELQEKNKVFI